MNESAARSRIVLELQPSADPTLTEAEVDAVVAEAAFTPVGGSEDYTMRGIYRALALGTRVRCNKIAGQFDVKADTVEAKRSQAYAQCLQQEEMYRRLASRTEGSTGEPGGGDSVSQLGWLSTERADCVQGRCC